MSIANLVENIAATHNLRRRSENRPFAGPCPFCGGSAKSDKFQIRNDGGWKCYACGETGDIITWLRKQEGLSCGAAHAKAGKECQRVDVCPAADKCRFGRKGKKGGSSGFRPRQAPAPRVSTPAVGREVAAITPEYPPAEFVLWATALLQKAQQQLQANTEQLAYLAGRGIDAQAVQRFGLGWLNHAYYPLRTELGLPAVSKAGRKKVWIPEGLLIPITKNGTLHRLRVRRTPETRKRFSEDLKYYWVRPSGNLPLAIAPQAKRARGAVIVEAELDAMAIAAHHPDVAVIALGTVAGGIDSTLRSYLAGLPVILVALDAEQQSVESVRRWRHTFPYARFWVPPQGKDAGDFFAAGGNLYDWIEAGLPPKPPERKKQELKTLSLCEQEEKAKEAIGKNYVESQVSEIELVNGVKFYVTDSECIWQQYTATGKAVFSKGELERLRPLMTGKNDDERLDIAMNLIETKLAFGGYVSRFRPSTATEQSTAEV